MTTHSESQPHAHVSSMGMLIGVFGALLVLTVVTVAVAYVDLGELNLFIALAIATVKALLVSIFFMHLRHDSGFNRLAFFGSFLFVALFVSITLMDTGQYVEFIDWSEKVLKEPAAAATQAAPTAVPPPGTSPSPKTGPAGPAAAPSAPAAEPGK